MHCYVPRYDWPAVWRIQVSVRGPAGNRKRNSSAAIQRSCYCGGAGKYCLFTVPVLLLTNMYHHECMLLFFFQPSAFEEKAIEKVDDLLESYMGIRDSELGEYRTTSDLCENHSFLSFILCAFTFCSLPNAL